MTVYRIYTISTDGHTTLRKVLHGSTDKEALRAAVSLCRALPGVMTWLLDCDRENELDIERSKPN